MTMIEEDWNSNQHQKQHQHQHTSASNLPNGKAANVQPFLNSLALEVKKYGLDSAVEVTNATGTINLLTHHGSFSNTDAEAFFNDTRKEQITGIATAGGAATLSGTGNATQLLQAEVNSATRENLSYDHL